MCKLSKNEQIRKRQKKQIAGRILFIIGTALFAVMFSMIFKIFVLYPLMVGIDNSDFYNSQVTDMTGRQLTLFLWSFLELGIFMGIAITLIIKGAWNFCTVGWKLINTRK